MRELFRYFSPREKQEEWFFFLLCVGVWTTLAALLGKWLLLHFH